MVFGVISILFSFLSLGMVIDALMTTRILVQFIGQIAAQYLLRKNNPDGHRPFKMWLYPLPSLIALFGWIFAFATSDKRAIFFGLGTLVAGLVLFLVWARQTRRWPFDPKNTPG